MFIGNYRLTCRNFSDEIADSQDLYDKTVSAIPIILPGFGDTPVGFRNGVLHQRMNNKDIDLKWRVTKK
jgi:hypothetical protein